MRGVLKCGCVLLACALIASAVASCASPAEPTAAPPIAPTTAQVAAPTTAPSPTAVPVPTTAPTSAPTPAGAQTEPTTSSAAGDGVPRMGLDELKALLDEGASVVVLDVRVKESYELGHIKGALLFPWKANLTVADVESLPFADLIVTYCDCGPGEFDSDDVAQQLIEQGAEADVKVLADPSITGWIEAGYPTETE